MQLRHAIVPLAAVAAVASTIAGCGSSSSNAGNIDPDASTTVALSKAGTFKYHCSIHPFMHGTLVVK